MKNQLRIIGGEWRRRQLSFASIEGLRPTPDRVRETLFNWLMWDIQNTDVLDLCTGSGALSFEALSRGAKHVHMIEPNRSQFRFLQENVQLLNANSRCTLYADTAQQALIKFRHELDVVFLDPPYSLDLWSSLAALVDPLIKSQGFIYVEADRSLETLGLPSSWVLSKSTKAGTVHAGLFRKP